MSDQYKDAMAAFTIIEHTSEPRAAFKAFRSALVADGWSETMAEQIAGQAFAAMMCAVLAKSIAEVTS